MDAARCFAEPLKSRCHPSGSIVNRSMIETAPLTYTVAVEVIVESVRYRAGGRAALRGPAARRSSEARVMLAGTLGGRCVRRAPPAAARRSGALLPVQPDSPRRSSGVRTFRKNQRQRLWYQLSGAVQPDGWNDQPFLDQLAATGMEPGAIPPISAWCARLATNPMSVRRRLLPKTGETIVTSADGCRRERDR